MACDECRWKTQKNDCPSLLMYKNIDYGDRYPRKTNALAIKGIRMPDNCHECDSLGISDLVGIKCPCDTDKCYSYDGRPDGCPLTEVKVN